MKFFTSLLIFTSTILATPFSSFALTKSGAIHLQGVIENRAELIIVESPEARNLRLEPGSSGTYPIGKIYFSTNGANITLTLAKQDKLKNGDFYINYRLAYFTEDLQTHAGGGASMDFGEQILYKDTSSLPLEAETSLYIYHTLSADDFKKLRSGIYSDDIIITLTSN